MEIEKGIDLPEPHYRATSWPFSDMNVGDSILVDGVRPSPTVCRGYNAAKQYERKHLGVKFSGRKQGSGKVRIWRVS